MQKFEEKIIYLLLKTRTGVFDTENKMVWCLRSQAIEITILFHFRREQNTCDILTVKNVSHLRNKWILKTSSINGITERQRKPITSCRMSLEIASAADHFQAWGGEGADGDWRIERPRQIQFSVRMVTSSIFPHIMCLRQHRIDLAYVTAVYSQALFESQNCWKLRNHFLKLFKVLVYIPIM